MSDDWRRLKSTAEFVLLFLSLTSSGSCTDQHMLCKQRHVYYSHIAACTPASPFRFSLLLNSKAEKLKELRDTNTGYLEELTRLKPTDQHEPDDEGLIAQEVCVAVTRVICYF